MSVYQKISTLPDEVLGPLFKKAFIRYRNTIKTDQEHPMYLGDLTEFCNRTYGSPQRSFGNIDGKPISKENFQPIIWTDEDVARAMKHLKKDASERREMVDLMKGLESRLPEELNF